jgi:5-hydroxyisourate hydrolase
MRYILASIITAVSFSALSAPEGTLSVHVLNQQTGLPAAKVVVELDKQQGDNWAVLASKTTNEDGRINSLYPKNSDMLPGVYRVLFLTGDYFAKQQQATFFPSVPVIFKVDSTNQKLHVPLLLSQYGYSTYRGS